MLRAAQSVGTIEAARRIAEEQGLALFDARQDLAVLGSAQSNHALAVSMADIERQADGLVIDLLARSYSRGDNQATLEKLRALIDGAVNPLAMRQHIAREVLSAMTESSLDPQSAVAVLEETVRQNENRDEAIDSMMIEIVMGHVYGLKNLPQSYRLVEFVEKLSERSKDSRVQGLAYKLVHREEDHAKNREYKASLIGAAARIAAQAGGQEKLIMPFVPPVPGGALATKFKSGMRVGESLILHKASTWIESVVYGLENHYGITVFSGAAMALVNFLLWQHSIGLMAIGAFSWMILDMFRKGVAMRQARNDDDYLLGAAFHMTELVSLFLGAIASLPGALSGASSTCMAF